MTRRIAVYPVALAAVALWCALSGPSRLSGQTGPAQSGALERADSLYEHGDAARALEALGPLLGDEAADYAALWRAARAEVALGLLAGDGDEARRWFEAGVAHGTAAARVRDDGVDGLYWLAAATGRLSFLLSPKGSAEAGQRVYEISHRILALDSTHAGAEDALGKISYRVMRLSGAARFLSRALLRHPALRGASWEDAELHLRRAVALDPEWIVPHADLGEVFLHTGRYEDAVRELERAIELPVRHPGDRAYQAKAAEELPFARAGRKP